MSLKMPKKITPDSIKQAVVEIRYTSDLPFEVIIGFMYKGLDDSYIYKTASVEHTILFYNNIINIKVAPGSIVFICPDKYIGWQLFEQEIEKALTQFLSSGFIKNVTRVGVRYISEYQDKNLEACTNLNIKVGLTTDFQNNVFTFMTQYYSEGFRVGINLGNNMPTLPEELDIDLKDLTTNKITIPTRPVSLIDIDVIRENMELLALNDIILVINKTHEKQKEVFFSLLNSDFLNTLNPEY